MILSLDFTRLSILQTGIDCKNKTFHIFFLFFVFYKGTRLYYSAKARTGYTAAYSFLLSRNGSMCEISISANSFTFSDRRGSSMLLGFKESTSIAKIASAIMF